MKMIEIKVIDVVGKLLDGSYYIVLSAGPKIFSIQTDDREAGIS